jgi:antibiotic biosynthesis monooxygenase (ABM) superfamily enzyme
VTWCAALPVSILISLLIDLFLDGEPFLVQKVVFVTLLVVLLTWVVIPAMSRVAGDNYMRRGRIAITEIITLIS